MRTMTQKFRDVGLIEMLADAYKNKRNARIGTKILKPESYQVFPDGVVFTCTVLGEISANGFQQERLSAIE